MHTYSYSQIWKIAFPVLISTLMEQLIGMTDTAFLGRIGEVELGASALGGIFFVTIFMLGLGFSIGAQILMGGVVMVRAIICKLVIYFITALPFCFAWLLCYSC